MKVGDLVKQTGRMDDKTVIGVIVKEGKHTVEVQLGPTHAYRTWISKEWLEVLSGNK